jgi:MarR family 2-MHQ and catechol resistance regulon transcriptional repressor
MKTVDLIWLGQRLSEAGRDELRALAPDVPTAELMLMRDLLENPPSTITALAERTGYAQSRVSTAVSSLVARGWAQTGSDAADGRRTLVSIPDDLRRRAEEFRSNADSHTLDGLLAELPAIRRKAIVSALEELVGVLRRQLNDQPAASE